MGKIIARNMLSWLELLINRLLHLVGCLYYLYQRCTVKKILYLFLFYFRFHIFWYFRSELRLYVKTHRHSVSDLNWRYWNHFKSSELIKVTYYECGSVYDTGVPYLSSQKEYFIFPPLKIQAAISSEEIGSCQYGVTSHKTVMFVVTAVRTWDLMVFYVLALVTLDPSNNEVSFTASSGVEMYLTAGRAPERVDNCSCSLLQLVTYIQGVKKSRVINGFQ